MSRRVRHPESGAIRPLHPIMSEAVQALALAEARRAESDRARVTAFWQLGDGSRIATIVYALRDCPPLSGAAYILASRSNEGDVVRLAVGRSLSVHPTLNLARIRYLGANVGATEVHVARCGRGGVALSRLADDMAAAVAV